MGQNCCMSGKKKIIRTMNKFYYCTYLPIKAFGKNGNLIHTEGYSKEHENILKLNDILIKFQKKYENERKEFIEIEVDSIKFTAASICPKSIDKGVFVIGPYVDIGNKISGIVQKPSDCMIHIIALLRNIGESSGILENNIHEMHGIYVKRALFFIKNHFHENLTIDYISKQLGISKCYFCSIFKKETGKTFTQILNETRIESSKKLLTETNETILDIAISIGYNNQNYYTMMFKKINKMTPNLYRKNHSKIKLSNNMEKDKFLINYI